MAKYILNKNYIKHWKLFRKIWVVLISVILLILVVVIAVLIDSYFIHKDADKVSVSEITTSTIARSVEIFDTQYFQFQTSKNWQFVERDSDESIFVYNRTTNGLVEAIMTVHIDEVSAKTEAATRILPVSIAEGVFSLDSGTISEHCKESIPKEQRENSGDLPTKISSVDFVCDTDGNGYTIAVGLEDGTTRMNLTRPDGTEAEYMIFFNDVRFNAIPDEFEDIVSTFQIR